ncbi:Rho GTPase activation protein [Polychytrium aggregatum]|uniref:Rho GTPase activation protein n=1 Tax=Polychytrium aggregatum TaxID=110093 RepID=UPI0022FE8B0D|nr:Rho GTPase activation protein [Polychytrium aggregatum]KAI9199301.1 Rho GTPase activation protein [Polychytrium aggregatum]
MSEVADESQSKASLTSSHTLPRAKGSKVNVDQQGRSFEDLTLDDLKTLQDASLARLNTIFQETGSKCIDKSLIRTINEQTGFCSKRRWWPLKGSKKEPIVPVSISKCQLVRAVQFAGVPYHSSTEAVNCRRIPILLHECMRKIRESGLGTNGLFRINGSEKRIQALAQQFDTAPTTFEGCTSYDAADLLKRYIRELPEPLIPTELYPLFLKAIDLPCEKAMRIRAFRFLLLLLPPPHIVAFESILCLVGEVAARSSENQMTAHNLARIFAPNILRSKQQKQSLDEYERCSFVTEYLIEHWTQFLLTGPELKPFEILDASYLTQFPGPRPETDTKA